MLLTDYFRSTPDAAWEVARQCGVAHAVIRLPEEDAFDICQKSHWEAVHKRFTDFGVKPVIIEPMPNALHDHIKLGDEKRDECIEKVIRMFPIMRDLDIGTICFNFMAHIGWLRTRSDFPERAGATVTAFDLKDFTPTGAKITAQALWNNYTYFLDAVIPEAETYGIRLALHPDDPPVPRLGDVERILISADAIRRAVFEIHPSRILGLTMCQANFHIMGEDLKKVTDLFREKIFFIHFRNAIGTSKAFRETFHDNGEIDMAGITRYYVDSGIDVPVRVDHVPTMPGEISQLSGYDALGRYYSIGYLKGILAATAK